ncbi:MAG: translation initiation factor [Planctomycetia bacterium]|nr:translation initiation factor [Planctomycetia bacterium]
MRLFAGTPWDRPPTCERCGKVLAECRCPPAPSPPREYLAPQKQTARLALEKRGGGRFVTVIHGLSAADNDLAALLAKLKAEQGAGGTVKDDTIEIQGKHLERVREALLAIGYKVKG